MGQLANLLTIKLARILNISPFIAQFLLLTIMSVAYVSSTGASYFSLEMVIYGGVCLVVLFVNASMNGKEWYKKVD